MRHAGQVAIVTGAGTGLGAATARLFAQAGATVALTGRRRDKLEATARTIESEGGRAIVLPCDMARADDVGAMVDEAARRGGGLDILINNAGRHAQFLPTAEVTLADFDDYFAINLRGPFVATQAALPHLLARGGGAIVNIASMAGLVGLKYATAYCAMKGGLIQLTRAVAVEVADRNIRVNCVCPGGMEPTESRRHMSPEELARVGEAIQGGSPAGRPADVFAVARFVLTLADPAMGGLTGAIIPFDGGYTAR
jgi:NAD(P)-dependent dehydrogenase (short-subunit alcohol dehydrogenase family)